MQKYILLSVIIVGGIIFILSLCKNKLEVIVNFILRSIVGVIGIYLVNHIVELFGIYIYVGINEYTTLTVGFLGLPGFILLYSLSILFVETN